MLGMDVGVIVLMALVIFISMLAGGLLALVLFLGAFLVYLFSENRIASKVVLQAYSIGSVIINRVNSRVYKDLDLTPSSSQIRLVYILPGLEGSKIRCKLVLGDWKTSCYEALSYAWGNAVLVQPIELNGRMFLITGNLYTALDGLRDEFQERAVWIDALSINQRDFMEREHQVQQMRQIYASASSVQVSLGADHPDVDFAFRAIRNSASNSALLPADNMSPAYSYSPTYSQISSTIRDLLCHGWWERIWVVQEVAVAKRIEIFCGSSTVPWESFRHYVTQRHAQPEPEDSFGQAMFKFLSRGLSVLQTSPALEYGLLDLAHEFRSRHATNPGDKLSALLGLLSDSEDRVVIPDYTKSVSEVYTDFVTSHIKQYKSLAIFSFAEYRDAQSASLPSWCLNWTIQTLYPTPFWKNSTADLHMWLHESRTTTTEAEIRYQFSSLNPAPRFLGSADSSLTVIGSEATLPFEHRSRVAVDIDWSKIPWATHRFSSRPRQLRRAPERKKSVAQADWKELALGPWSSRISQYSPYPHEPERSNAYYHTLIAGVLGDRDIDWSFMRDAALFDEGDFLGKREICRSIDLACLGRKFFITRRGFMGLAPADAQKGDLITVLFGGNIPFVLRRGGQQYRMLGQTYVHGIMAYKMAEMETDIKIKRVIVQDFSII